MTPPTDPTIVDASRAVIALVRCYHNGDDMGAAQLLASMTHTDLAMVAASAGAELANMWEICADDAGITLDQFCNRVLEALEDGA